MSNLKNIKPRTLHHPEYHQVERLRLLNKRDGFKPEQACLMKYFPKYYKRLKTEISLGAWPLISKLRQIKTIDHFESPRVDGIPKTKPTKALGILEQRIFRNKRKSAKSVPLLTTNTFFVGFQKKPQLSSFFPMITSLNLMEVKDLNLNREEVMFVDKALERDLFDCYNYFWKSMRNIRHLQISTQMRYSWFIIKQINSSPLFLSRLKTLGLSLKLEFDEAKLAHPRNMLKELSENERFLRHLTHLDCKNFEGFHHYDEFVSQFLVQCPNLVSLNSPIGREAHRYSSPDEIYKECQDTGALEQIRQKKKLQELTVSVYGINTFIKHFCLPKSLKKIELNVLHSFYDPNLLDLFDFEFFKRWKELSDLKTLKIKMRRTTKSNDLLLKFVLPLLQMTPNLRKFRLALENSPAFRVSKCEAIDISLFHERVAGLKHLESFKISNCAMSRYSQIFHLITFDPKKCHFLSRLKKVSILGVFSEKLDFQDFLPLPSEANEKELKMSTFIFDSVEALNECVKSANRAVSFGNLNLELKILLMTENLEEISSSMERPIVLENNLIVRLDICWKTKIWGGKAKTIIEQNIDALQKLFANFDMQVAPTYL